MHLCFRRYIDSAQLHYFLTLHCGFYFILNHVSIVRFLKSMNFFAAVFQIQKDVSFELIRQFIYFSFLNELLGRAPNFFTGTEAEKKCLIKISTWYSEKSVCGDINRGRKPTPHELILVFTSAECLFYSKLD